MQQSLISVQPSIDPKAAIYFLEPNKPWALLTKWLIVTFASSIPTASSLPTVEAVVMSFLAYSPKFVLLDYPS
jgi:hypothetical protein